VFRRQSAIFRESANTKDHKPNTPLQLLIGLPEDGTPVPKNAGVILTMNCDSCFVMYCILLLAFVGQYIEDAKMNGMSNIKIYKVNH